MAARRRWPDAAPMSMSSPTTSPGIDTWPASPASPVICCRAATRSRALPRAASFAVIHHRYRQRMKTLKGMFPNAPGARRPASPGARHIRLRRVRLRPRQRSSSSTASARPAPPPSAPPRTRPDGDVRYRIIESISDPGIPRLRLRGRHSASGLAARRRGGHGDGPGRARRPGPVPRPVRPRDPADAQPGSRSTLPCSRCGCSGTAGRVSPRPSSPPPARPASPVRRSPRSTRISRRHCRSAPSRSWSTWPAAPGRSPGPAAVRGRRRRDELRRHRQDPRRRPVGRGLRAARPRRLRHRRSAPRSPPTATSPASSPGGPVALVLPRPGLPGLHPGRGASPGLSARQVADPARYLAAQLAAGKIAGLFQGRLEAGPRALGNRSILASPLLPDVTGAAERRGEVP